RTRPAQERLRGTRGVLGTRGRGAGRWAVAGGGAGGSSGSGGGVWACPSTETSARRSSRSRRGLARLRDLVQELGVERVVVGLPLSLSGEESQQTAEARAFSTRLAGVLPVPVELYDERLTTRLATRMGGRASEDSRAAAHLLEGWLASRASRDQPSEPGPEHD
ncbi:MAG: Holliday junction resolvase RuvX, partial [Solirubrobacteraceae bacterium]